MVYRLWKYCVCQVLWQVQIDVVSIRWLGLHIEVISVRIKERWIVVISIVGVYCFAHSNATLQTETYIGIHGTIKYIYDRAKNRAVSQVC